MALQMATALAAAFAIGRTIWPGHWAWVVLTAFIVCSGARGRGDVVLKGALRGAGAAAGTAVATAVAGTFGPHADASVVVMFAAVAVATWLREFSYAWWAACVTAVLSLLYGWFGQAPGGLLETRLEGIAVGAALGIAASWLILPVRTSDVARRRAADALAALSGVLTADWRDPAALGHRQAAFQHTVISLGQIAPPLRAQRLLLAPLRGTRPGARGWPMSSKRSSPAPSRSGASSSRHVTAPRPRTPAADPVRRATEQGGRRQHHGRPAGDRAASRCRLPCGRARKLRRRGTQP